MPRYSARACTFTGGAHVSLRGSAAGCKKGGGRSIGPRVVSGLGLGAALTLLGLGGAAGAATPVTVGLLGIDGSTVPAGMGQTVTDTLRRLVPQLSGMSVKPHSQDAVEVKAIFDCQDERPSCMAQIGRSLSVNRLIFGTVKRQPGGAFTIQLKQLNVADATVDKFVNETVQAGVLQQPNPQLDTLAQRWLHVLLVEGLRGGLKVTSEPPGATVLLDGAPIGQTPIMQSDVEVGNHVLSLELAGHTQVVRTVTILGGTVHEVTAQLAHRGRGGGGGSSGPGDNRPSGPTNWSRVLTTGSYVLLGIAGVSAISAIGTWRGYVAAEDRASSQLDMLQRQLTEQGKAGMYGSFFGSAQRLSTCMGESSLAGAYPSYDAYLSDCQSGNTLAKATTGLWVVAASTAALGLTSMVVGRMLHRPDPKVRNERVATPPPASDGTAPTGEPAAAPAPAPVPPPSTDFQLEQLAPVVGPTGAGFTASFRF